MANHDGRRLVHVCSLLDMFEEVMKRVERITTIMVRITRDAVMIAGMILGALTGSGALHQAAVLFE